MDRVVCQKTVSYRENLEKLRPDIVVCSGICDGPDSAVRNEIASVLASYGGRLVDLSSF
ncbi:MAG: hypothetical protein J6128_05795 [Clostridia bacterium]|nr:hypothetical protein [Clostridia bacterium]